MDHLKLCLQSYNHFNLNANDKKETDEADKRWILCMISIYGQIIQKMFKYATTFLKFSIPENQKR